MTFTLTKYLENSFSFYRDFSFTIRNKLIFYDPQKTTQPKIPRRCFLSQSAVNKQSIHKDYFNVIEKQLHPPCALFGFTEALFKKCRILCWLCQPHPDLSIPLLARKTFKTSSSSAVDQPCLDA